MMLIEALSIAVILAIFFSCCWISYLAGIEVSKNKAIRLLSDKNKKIIELELALHKASKNDKRDPKTGRFVK